MSENKPWPLGYRNVFNSKQSDLNSIAFEVAFTESVPAPERWRCHELDRHAVQPYDQLEPLAWKTFMVMSGEFVDRFGYEEAQRYVTAVLDARHDEDALLPFIDLVTNLRLRFGPKGPVALGAMLAAELAVTGRGR